MTAGESRRAAWLVVAAALSVGNAAAAESSPECALVIASTRLEAYGYSHVVTLTNHCQAPVTCEVWTNVDPTPRLWLSAKSGETVETVTRRGSPSHDVQAGKRCRVSG